MGPALDGPRAERTGAPIDGGGPLAAGHAQRLDGAARSPLDRVPIRAPGNRYPRHRYTADGRPRAAGCIFGGSGVGKSTLIGMMTRNTEAEVTVVGLVGERGREVAEFLRDSLGAEA